MSITRIVFFNLQYVILVFEKPRKQTLFMHLASEKIPRHESQTLSQPAKDNKSAKNIKLITSVVRDTWYFIAEIHRINSL